MDSTTSKITFFLNGRKVVEDKADPEWTLLYYLRTKLGLCGAKAGCGEGGCGACSVLASQYDRDTKKIIHRAVNACLFPICAVHGLAITTVEGIGSTQRGLHPVQERLAKAHGSQCGFCTPGIVMSMYALLRSLSRKPTMNEIEEALQGNLCRCTGYRPILEGFRSFSDEAEGACPLREKCCKNVIGESKESIPEGLGSQLFSSVDFTPYDPSQETIFPPELQVSPELDSQYLIVKGPRVTWYRPLSLNQLLALKIQFPQAKIVNGNTELGIETKYKNTLYPILIYPDKVNELHTVTRDQDGIYVGAALTITELEKIFIDEMKKNPEHQTRVLKAFLESFKWFGAAQVRNVGTIGGNIMTGSPVSDLNPIIMAAKCRLQLTSQGSTRFVFMDENFWTGYRKNILRDSEILTSIFIPYTKASQFISFYKQGKRRVDDVSIVNAAILVELEQRKIVALSLAYGGLGEQTLLAKKTSFALVNKEWRQTTLNEAYSKLIEDFPLQFNAIGGAVTFRRCLTLSFFFKFFITVQDALNKCEEYERSAKEHLRNLSLKSSQYFSLVPKTQEKYDLVGRPIVHQSAYKSTTGEALFCDDISNFEGELYMAFVLSSRAHAKILSVDPSEALKLPGVVSFFSSTHNPPTLNNFGPVEQDEEIFAVYKVKCEGQIIGAVVANNRMTAERAKKLVKVEYESIHPTVITIEDAIKERSFMFDKPLVMKFGDFEKEIKEAEHVIDGEMRVGSQEHFYLEPHCAVAVPKQEDNEIEIFSSTQQPTAIQTQVARALGIPSNRVVCRVKRIGGGFGGKETRAALIALPAAVAAHQLQKPVRVALDREEDMMLSGKRHAVFAKYRIGFSSSGKITCCELHAYANGGCTVDVSEPLIERVLFHFQNAYNIPNIVAYGYVCKTNTQSNTAFRGTGAPQGMLIGETMIRHIAETLGLDAVKVTELNLYKDGDRTHYNQSLKDCNVRRCWEECIKNSNFNERQKEIQSYNKENRWRKRGISMVPTMFGIAFGAVFLNQAGALVLIYTDGSVLISHGGVEIGQGLHTKMIQVASRALGIPSSLIHISETSTDKVPNTSPTAASSSSDLNGMAVLNACSELNERLRPIKEAKPSGTWEEWIKEAYLSRVSLAASSFYKTPDLGYNPENKTSNYFNYFTYGAACSEVEIDCLTGDHRAMRTDIVMDVGESLNPAVDIGQIEGAFMQGYGLYTLEDLLVSPDGRLLSKGPGNYKIPAFSDIPARFNVTLLKGASNPRAVYSSKAIGEPPLFLSSSIFFAIREAVKAARQDAGKCGWFNFRSPATSARIRMGCEDEITQKFAPASSDGQIPWNIELA